MKPLRDQFTRFDNEMAARQWSADTRDAYRDRLERFAKWLESEQASVTALSEITPDTVSAYQLALCKAEKKRGGPLAPASQHAFLTALKSFFRFLVAERILIIDPTRALELPKLGRRLPQGLMTTKEVRSLMRQPDLGTYVGLRDRAILETLYSTGLRNSELRHLTVHDIDLERGFVTVLRGKGKKDRVVPLGKIAAHFVRDYLGKARPHLVREAAQATLFLCYEGGRPLAMNTLIDIVHRNAKAAGLKKRTFPHGIRHTCATGMLRGRADIRYIQELLGHESLSSTEIYTHVEIRDLKRVHARAHPRERDLPPDSEWD